MAVLGVHHVSLIVADTARALEFYQGVLGLMVSDARPDMSFSGAWLELGGQQLHLLELPNPDPALGRPEYVGRDRHLALSVEDVDALAATLQQARVAYRRSGSGRAALFCRDPDGNGLEFVQVG